MIIVDIEASGADPEINSILSLGAVDFDNPDNRIYLECRMRPDAEWNPESAKIHGFTEEQVSKHPLSEEELVRKFMEWALPIKNKTLAGQCVHFDRNYLFFCFRKYHFAWIFGYRMVDSHSLMYALMEQRGMPIPLDDGTSKITLDSILVFLGIPRRTGNHNALHDALLEAECFSRLFYNKNLIKEYAEHAK